MFCTHILMCEYSLTVNVSKFRDKVAKEMILCWIGPECQCRSGVVRSFCMIAGMIGFSDFFVVVVVVVVGSDDFFRRSGTEKERTKVSRFRFFSIFSLILKCSFQLEQFSTNLLVDWSKHGHLWNKRCLWSKSAFLNRRDASRYRDLEAFLPGLEIF